MVVDNAWNQDHAQSEASLAAGKQSVERIVRGFWGLCEPIDSVNTCGAIATRSPGASSSPSERRATA